MTRLPPRDRRLATDLQRMEQLLEKSNFITFEARPDQLPEEYIVTYTCLGLVTRPEWGPGPLPADWRRRPPRWVSNKHIVHIYLPVDYPTLPPQVRFKTPVYHPNIRHLADGEKKLQIITENIGGVENLQRAFESNPELREKLQDLFASYVCIDGIILPERGGNYQVKTNLDEICIEIGQMIMFQMFELAHGLNDDATAWTKFAIKQKNMLPIDNQSFLNKLDPVIRLLNIDKEDGIDIEVLGVD